MASYFQGPPSFLFGKWCFPSPFPITRSHRIDRIGIDRSRRSWRSPKLWSFIVMWVGVPAKRPEFFLENVGSIGKKVWESPWLGGGNLKIFGSFTLKSWEETISMDWLAHIFQDGSGWNHQRVKMLGELWWNLERFYVNFRRVYMLNVFPLRSAKSAK